MSPELRMRNICEEVGTVQEHDGRHVFAPGLAVKDVEAVDLDGLVERLRCGNLCGHRRLVGARGENQPGNDDSASAIRLIAVVSVLMVNIVFLHVRLSQNSLQYHS